MVTNAIDRLKQIGNTKISAVRDELLEHLNAITEIKFISALHEKCSMVKNAVNLFFQISKLKVIIAV